MVKQYLSTKHILVIAAAMISGIAKAEDTTTVNSNNQQLAVVSQEVKQEAAPVAPWYARVASSVSDYAQIGCNHVRNTGSQYKTMVLALRDHLTGKGQKAIAANDDSVAKEAVTTRDRVLGAMAATGSGAAAVALVNDPKVISRLFESKPVSMWEQAQNAANSAYYAVVGKPDTMFTRTLNAVKAKAPSVSVPASVKAFPGQVKSGCNALVSKVSVPTSVKTLVNKVPSKAQLSESVKALSGKALESGYNAIGSIKANPRTSAAVVLGTVATAYAAKLAYDYYKTPKALKALPAPVLPKTFEDCVAADIATIEKGGDRGTSALVGLEVQEGTQLAKCKKVLVDVFAKATLDQYKHFVSLANKKLQPTTTA